MTKSLVRLVEKAGLTARERDDGAVEILGGPFRVTFWPEKLRYQVAGTIQKDRGHIEKAIHAALHLPPKRAKRAKRYNRLRKRKALLKLHPYCYWCGCGLVLRREELGPGLGLATRDHVIPHSRGGSDKRSNVVLACEPCNTKRGDRMPELEGSCTTS